jgi:transposase
MYSMLTLKQLPESNSELDLQTIRQRVAAIKRNWTPEEVRERAVEGRQRRKQLEELVRQLENDCDQFDSALLC